MNTPQLNIQELETLKSSIDTMNRANHVEILKILKENDVKINENKSGVYINMSFLEKGVIEKISTFVKYIEEQEKSLEIVERQKIELSSSIERI
jgi:hypothetical protein